MKLKGEFVLREIAGETILVPVGRTALAFNGIITLNQTGIEIWKGLQEEKSREEILAALLEQFEVAADAATEDLDAFLVTLRAQDLIEM